MEPVPQPVSTLEPVPQPVPTLEPVPQPVPTLEPVPQPVPTLEPVPQPVPTLEPVPQPTPEQVLTPEPTPELVPQPVPTLEPVPQPVPTLEPVPQPVPTLEPVPQPTPEQVLTPEPTPELVPQPTPEQVLTPEPTPELVPQPVPTLEPVPQPVPKLEPVPEPTPEQVLTPEPTPEQVLTPEPTPELVPQPVPTLEPVPQPVPTLEPVPQPVPTLEPVPQPVPTLEPVPEPTPEQVLTPEPTPELVPQPVPTLEPVPQPVPTLEPVPQPTPEQVLTPEPTPEPVPQPVSTLEPVPQPVPTLEPVPQPVPTLEPVPEPTPEPVPQPVPTLEPVPQPVPKLEPVPQPVPTLEPVPQPVPTLEPVPQPIPEQVLTPEPTPELVPQPVPTLEPVPQPVPTLEPVPQPIPEQVLTPEPTPELVPQPVPTLEPVPQPVPTLEPVPQPVPTLEPVPQPVPTLEPVPQPVPTLEPVPEPTPEQVLTPEPTPELVPQPVPTLEPVPQPVPTLEPVPQPTPEQVLTPEPTPEPVPQPVSTLEPVPQPVPTLEPVPQPVPTLEPVPEPTPEPVPQPVPTLEPVPQPVPTLEPVPQPVPTLEPVPEPTPEQVLTPEQTPELVPQPVPTLEPVPQPVPTLEPVPQSVPTLEPVPQPVPTIEPVPEPTPEQVLTPEPTPELVPQPVPTLEPVPQPVPTLEPVPQPVPTLEPVPEPTPEQVLTPEPTPELVPQPVPTLEPVPQPVPTLEPVPQPVPTLEPVPEPTPEQVLTPEPTPELVPQPVSTLEPVPQPVPTLEPVPQPVPTLEPVPEPVPTSVNNLPVFTSSPILTANEDSVYTYNITVTDDDNQICGITSSTLPNFLTLTDNGNNTATLTGIPLQANLGDNSVLIVATDPSGGITNQSFVISVSNVNDLPLFTSSPVLTADEDSVYTYNITISDEDNQICFITSSTLPNFLTLTDNRDNTATLTGTPLQTNLGDNSVVIVAIDPSGGITNQSFVISVSNVNDLPVFTSSPVLTADEDSVYTYNITVTDEDNQICDITSSTLPSFLTLTNNNDNTATLTGTPLQANLGDNSVVIVATDPSGGITNQSFVISVSNVNDLPVFTSSPVLTGNEDSVYTYNIIVTDDDNQICDITSSTLPNFLTLTDNGDNTATLTGIPLQANLGDNSVVIVATDPSGGITNQSFVISVSNVNDLPVFTSSPVLTADEDSVYTYNITISDEDNQICFITSSTLPNFLTLTDNRDNTATLTGTPLQTNLGDNSVVIVAIDPSGGITNQSFVISVSNVNDLPVFTSSPVLTADEDSVYTYNITVTDEDNQICDITSSTLPSFLTLTNNNDNTATLTGTPLQANLGDNSVVIVATDPSGGITNQSFVISVSNVNDLPVFTSSPVLTGNEDSVYTYNIIVTDDDNQICDITSSTLPNFLTLTDNGDNTATLTGIPLQANLGDNSVVIVATDPSGGITNQSFVISVSNVNDLPVFTSSPVLTGNEDSVYTYNITVTDEDNQICFITSSSIPSFLTLTDNRDNTAILTGTPLQANLGDNSVVIVAIDPSGGITNQSFVISVSNVNDLPVFTSSPILTIDEDSVYTYNITVTDEDNQICFITSSTLPSFLTLTDNRDNTATLTGTPLQANLGDNSVVIVAIDPSGGITNQSFVISVSNVNDLPVFTSSPVLTVDEDSVYTYNITVTDEDNQICDITSSTLPSFLTLTDNGDNTATLTGTPLQTNLGDNSVVIVANDPSGGITNQSFVISVSNVNDLPIFTSSPILTVDEDSVYTYNITVTDEENQICNITSSTLPSFLTLTDNGDNTATLTGTPLQANLGDNSVVIVATDPSGGITNQSFVISVSNINDLPVFTSSPILTADEDSVYTYNITITDEDNQICNITSSTLPSFLTLTDNGDNTATLTGTPLQANLGDNSVVIVATDPSGGITNQSFVITVSNVNDLPVFTSSPVLTGNEDSVYLYNIVLSDDDNQICNITSSTLPSFLTLTDNGDNTGTLTGTPLQANLGDNSVVIVATDPSGGITNQSFIISVSNVNDLPIFTSSPILTADEDSIYTYNITVTDEDNQICNITSSTLPSFLTLTDNGDNTATLTGTPLQANLGDNSVVIVATDPSGGITNQSFVISVSNVNDLPVFTSTPITTANNEDQYIYNISVNDEDNDDIQIEITNIPNWLNLVDNGDNTGILSGYATANDQGDNTIIIKATDSNGGITEQTFTINVEVLGLTQEITIQQGWNWISFYLQPDNLSLSGLNLVDFSGSSIPLLFIKSQAESSSYYQGFGWFGNLNQIDITQTYLFKNDSDTVGRIVYTGSTVSNITVNVLVGWNWISYPDSESKNLNQVLANANANDFIKGQGQNQNSQYYQGFGWFGSLTILEPGKGYLYKTNTNNSFLFNQSNTRSIISNNIKLRNYRDFQLNVNSYEFNASLSGILTMGSTKINSGILLAYINDEIRGISNSDEGDWLFFPFTGETIIILSIYSNVASGENVTFKYYDGTNLYDLQSNNNIIFQSNAIYGNAMSPIQFSGDELIEIIVDVPQPVPTPEPVPQPVPTPEPVPQPVPTPEPVPQPVPTPEPVPQPVPTPEPVPQPVPIPEPVPQPVPIPEPVPEPVPIPEPVPQPVPTPESVPQPVPTPEPVPQPVPTPEPVSTPEPVQQPEQVDIPEPTPEPAPVAVPEIDFNININNYEFNASLSGNLEINGSEIKSGILLAYVNNEIRGISNSNEGDWLLFPLTGKTIINLSIYSNQASGEIITFKYYDGSNLVNLTSDEIIFESNKIYGDAFSPIQLISVQQSESVTQPVPSPEPTQVAQPSPEPIPQPSPLPEPVPQPVLSPEPVPQPVPSPESVPQPSPAPEPVPQPVPVLEPIPQPSPIPEPIPQPQLLPEPVPQPVPSPEPVPQPIPVLEPATQPVPQPVPTLEPAPQPVPVLEPAPQPVPVLEPAPQPVSEPIPEPAPVAVPEINFNININNYEFNASLSGNLEINGSEIKSGILLAYVNNEIRGISNSNEGDWLLFPLTGKTIINLSIYSNQASGEIITFKYYDGSNLVNLTSDEIIFESNKIYGDAFSPIQLTSVQQSESVTQPVPSPEPTQVAQPSPEPIPQPSPVPEPVPQPVPSPESVQQPSPAPEPVPQPVPVPEPIPQPSPVQEPIPQPQLVPEPVPQLSPVSEPVSQPIPEIEPAPQPVSVLEPAPQPVPVLEPAPQPVSVLEPAPQPVPVLEPAPQPVPVLEPAPQPVSEPIPEPAQVAVPEIDFNININNYEFNASLSGNLEINGSEIKSGILLAYVNNEIRGISNSNEGDWLLFPLTGKTIINLSIYSNQAAGEIISFKYYDGSNLVNLTSDEIIFESNKIYGDAFSPIQLTSVQQSESVTQPVPSPEPTQVTQPSPEPIPQPSPEPVPQPVLSPEPVPQPVPSPESVQQPSPAPEPVPQPVPVLEPIPQPSPVLEPIPQPQLVPEPIPQPQLVPEQVPQPSPVSEPVPQPIPVLEPAPQPVPILEPVPQPVPTLEPVPQPVSVLEPVPQPVPVLEPAPQPVPVLEPAPQSVSEPIPEPAPVAVPEIDFNININNYEFNASLSGNLEINGSEIKSGILLAYVNNEIRGISNSNEGDWLLFPLTGKTIINLSIYSNQASGEIITFKYYDGSNLVNLTSDEIIFESNKIYGDAFSPIQLTSVQQSESVTQPVPSPEPTQVAQPSPEPIPQPSPVQEPVPQPVLSPEPVPQPVPSPESVQQPSPAPEPVPQPVPVLEPIPQPSPVPEPIPQPQLVPEPVPQPVPLPEPIPQPSPVSEPVPQPIPVLEPAPQPVLVLEPVPQPVPTLEPVSVLEPVPQPVPVLEPAPQPVPVLEPTPQPVPVLEPAPQPVSEPIPEPAPVAVPEIDFNININNYEFNASLSGNLEINGSEIKSGILLAYVNNEIRGISNSNEGDWLLFPLTGKTIINLSIYSNQASGEIITFKYYDGSNLVNLTSDEIIFESNKIYGDAFSPIQLTSVQQSELVTQPVPSPEPTQVAQPSPEPIPQPSPVPEPVPQPVLSPEPVPQPVPSPESVQQPSPAPEPVPQPVPVLEPIPQPSPVPEPIPQPQLVPEQVPQPSPVSEPVPQPSPVSEPVPQPSPVSEPVPQPVPVLEPVPQPVPVLEPVPQPVPTLEPVPQPVSVLEPAPQPVPVLEPAPQPVSEPIPEPAPVAVPEIDFNININNYEFNASLSGNLEINGSEIKSGILLAYVNNEIRGISNSNEGDWLLFPLTGKTIINLSIYSNQASGEIITFKYYDGSNLVNLTSDEIIFESNKIYGDAFSPIQLTSVQQSESVTQPVPSPEPTQVATSAIT